MAAMDFSKLHGTANDFVYVDARRGLPGDPAALATRLCDRHRGIGADGLILLLPSETADCRMRIYNSDGSTAEMCGNGIRGFAKFVLDGDLVHGNPLRVETDAGVKTVSAELDGGRVRRVAVDMGAPEWSGRRIPVDTDGEIVERPDLVRDVPLDGQPPLRRLRRRRCIARRAGDRPAVRASPVLPEARQH